MSLSSPLSYPTSPKFRSQKFRAFSAVAETRGAFDLIPQYQDWDGELLMCDVELPPMTRANGQPWAAFLGAAARRNSFLMGPEGDETAALGGVVNYATNLLLWSEEFQRSVWTLNQATVTGVDTISNPNSVTNAERITPNGGATDAYLYNSYTGNVASKTFTFSVYLKAATGTPTINLYIQDQSGNSVTVDGKTLSTSWARYSVTGTMASDDTGIRTYIGGGASWPEADGAVDMWGAQLEEASAVTTYKPVGGPIVYSDIARDHLSFDGSNDYVTITHNAAYNSNDLTVEEWWKSPSSAPAANLTLCSKWDLAGNDIEFAVELLTTGALRFTVSKTDNTSDVSATTTATYLDGKWHHFAAVKAAGGALTLYVDGVSAATGALGQEGDQTTHNVLVGNITAGSHANAFSGPLCEFRIWNTARTVTQIRDNLAKQLVGNESGLVGYWIFDEGTGTSLDDKTTTNNNGSVSGATWAELAKNETLMAGFVASTSDVFQSGDFFQTGTGSTARLRQVVTPNGVDSNAAGVAMVDFFPKWTSEPADQATITYSSPKGVFRLASNDREWDIDVAKHYGMAFSALQDP